MGIRDIEHPALVIPPWLSMSETSLLVRDEEQERMLVMGAPGSYTAISCTADLTVGLI